jgi:two-component system, NarL family, sensor histidine kinase DesK
LFTYCAACLAVIAPGGWGFPAVFACSVLAVLCSSLGGASNGTAIGYGASSVGVGLLMVLMSDLRARNVELTAARAELAETAVIRERERFARDLHDLLGHSLSVITLKAELAGRLLGAGPDAAAREVAELEQVARKALSEVRQAVSGYHQPTLERELAGARMALSAAGIEADVQEARVALDAGVEAVLAWAVREGATNVIRHGRARHCTLRVTASLADAGVEVIDDGVGDGGGAGRAEAGRAVASASAATASAATASAATATASQANGNAFGGHGLAGLAERARLVNGTLEAGALPGGGYRLAVTVPLSHA